MFCCEANEMPMRTKTRRNKRKGFAKETKDVYFSSQGQLTYGTKTKLQRKPEVDDEQES